jgi:prepilin-type N-terminal cleavage/methylation domain-containing protein
MFYKKNRGFTLVEMVIVIIIIGILAALAFPQFSKTKEHAIGKEAIVNLKLIAAAEKIYRMESTNQFYSSCQCLCSGTGAGCCDNTTNGCNYYLKLGLTPQNWNYSSTGAASTFSSTATRTATGGSYSGCTYTINNSTDEPTTADCP